MSIAQFYLTSIIDKWQVSDIMVNNTAVSDNICFEHLTSKLLLDNLASPLGKITYTVYNLSQRTKNESFNRFRTCAGLSSANLGLFNFFLRGDGVDYDEVRISTRETGLSVARVALRSSQCFCGLSKNCVCILLFPYYLVDEFDSCDSTLSILASR